MFFRKLFVTAVLLLNVYNIALWIYATTVYKSYPQGINFYLYHWPVFNSADTINLLLFSLTALSLFLFNAEYPPTTKGLVRTGGWIAHFFFLFVILWGYM